MSWEDLHTARGSCWARRGCAPIRVWRRDPMIIWHSSRTPASQHRNQRIVMQCSAVKWVSGRKGAEREDERKERGREKEREKKREPCRQVAARHDGMGWVDGWSGSLRYIGSDWLRFDWNELSSSTLIILYCTRKYCGSVRMCTSGTRAATSTTSEHE